MCAGADFILRLLRPRSAYCFFHTRQTHRILGWHMDCLQPSLEGAPTGKWHCPMCPPLSLPEFLHPLPPLEFHSEMHAPTDQGSPSNFQLGRASSVASTSYSHEPQTRAASSRKGKGKAIITDESEIESPLTRRQRRIRQDNKGKGRMSETEEEEPELDPTPRAKRMKLKLGAQPPTPSRMVVRLKLPPKSKGKEREEEESPRKDVFDDLLSAEDRDTSRTLIDSSDKARYEKSRTQAEVRPSLRDRLELYLTNRYRQNYFRPNPHHNLILEHHYSRPQDPSADRHTPNFSLRHNHPHRDPLTLPHHPLRTSIHNPRSLFHPSLHLRLHPHCEYEPFDLGNTISRLGMTLRFQRSMPICQMEGYGYASFV